MANEAKKHLEIKTYSLHGISVLVEIDYDNGTVSLLESRNKPKQWVFNKREIEYMAGWVNILDAMKYAIEQAEKSLQKHQDERDRELKRKEVSLHKAIAEHNKKP